MRNFLANNKIAVVEAAAVAGTTTLDSDVLDMKSYAAATFLALLGDVTATCVLTMTVQHGAASDGSDMVDSALSATFTAGAADADSKVLAVEVNIPTKRYVRARLARATANAVLGGIIAIQHHPREAPVTQDASVIASAFAQSPT